MHRLSLIASCCLVIAALPLWRHVEMRASDLAGSAVVRKSEPRASVSPSAYFSNSIPEWNPKAAAAYLDERAEWWMNWSRAQRDHETFCISCHTAVPYAMARPELRSAMGEQSPAPAEQRLLENVTKRVRLWREVEPFYSDKDRGEYKTVESRGTESVLNAFVLASHDARSGELSGDARLALANMWAEQVTSGEQRGAWRWLRFKNEPWEADDSDFYGAALAAIAVGIAPGDYRARPEIQSNLKLLREYLNRKAPDEPLMNRVVLLWAGAKLPGLVEPALARQALREVFAKQQADGGWSLASLAGNWSRHDNTAQDSQSDGYATGLIVYAVEQYAPARNHGKGEGLSDGAAMPANGRSPELPGMDGLLGRDVASRIATGRNWLTNHQDAANGYWPAASLNKNEANHISRETARFMKDAATAYAVLALNSRNGW